MKNAKTSEASQNQPSLKPTPATLPTPIKAKSETTEAAVDLQEQIRRRAFELYELRGRQDGRDLDDWLQAESEFMQQTPKTEAA